MSYFHVVVVYHIGKVIRGKSISLDDNGVIFRAFGVAQTINNIDIFDLFP